MAQKIPGIMEFPKDGRFWRVDWLGAVLPNPNISTEPGFQVVLSPFKENPLASDSKALAAINATYVDQQKAIQLGVGQLPLIDIGSIWFNGYKQNKFAGKVEFFTDLLINPSTTQVVPALHKVNDFSLIPFSSYRFGKAGAGSQLIAVSSDGYPYKILIPAMELIRFYYAVSTHLSHALFTGVFQHNLNAIINVDRSQYLPDDDRVILGLRQEITDEEAWVIARIRRSKEAAGGCKRIYDEVLRDGINRGYVHPSSCFPFEGKTSIRARVKWLRDSINSPWHCLVLSLEQCSAPMPYSELTVIRDNDGSQAEDWTDIPESDKQLYSRPKAKINKDGSLDLQSQHDTNAGIQPAELSLPTSRFTALIGRKPDKPTKEQCLYRRACDKTSVSLVVDELGTGQGGYGEEERTTQRLNIVPEHEEPKKTALPASFETFVEAVELLNQTEGFTAEIRTAELLEFMPLIKPASKWQWSYLDSSRRVRRKVIVADISFGGYCFNLIEFEQRKSEHFTVCMLSAGRRMLKDNELHSLLQSCAIKKGVWKNTRFDIAHVAVFKHTWLDTISFCNSVTDRIKNKESGSDNS
ncbi:MAG: hypothetical protein IBX50_09770 [Marinospirillum sp.]|uniref:hypothetical protein n=1 Tax=Marinospirillum sp. TaxID=2183934 RepID=UPI0019F0D364|nr:hypothetical protein [Marinospirillum sp.]MBE0506990.1 hypothetical protein [Marinospirillum sp.]